MRIYAYDDSTIALYIYILLLFVVPWNSLA